MNYSTAIFLINNKVRAMVVAYEPEVDTAIPWQNAVQKGKTSCGLPNRTTFKTLDASIKTGDFVVIPTSTRHNMTVCKVVEADVDINFDDMTAMEWIVAVVDRSGYELTKSQEGTAINAIRSAEMKKKRDDLRNAILADRMDAIKALPIASSE